MYIYLLIYLFLYTYIYIYIYIYIYRRLGVVSSSLDQPLTRKSISIALAFALRAKLRGREMLPMWLGVVGCNLSGWSGRPAGIWSVPSVPCKTTPLFFVRLLIAASRCFPLLPAASRGFPLLTVASRACFRY